jgi:hypothetical protein
VPGIAKAKRRKATATLASQSASTDFLFGTMRAELQSRFGFYMLAEERKKVLPENRQHLLLVKLMEV